MKCLLKIIMPGLAMGILLSAAISPVRAAESGSPSRIPAHTPEWTDYNRSDPGTKQGPPPPSRLQGVPGPVSPVDSVADDLQRVVVLCATRPQSTEFDRAWALYLGKHYEAGLDVDGLIERVISQAESRAGFGDGRRGARLETGIDRDTTRRRMRVVADSVIGTLR